MTEKNREVVMVSACLLGRKCRYDGEARLDPALVERLAGVEIAAICPEVMGGLSVPRPRSRMVGGTGREVVAGRAQIVFEDSGKDVTSAFLHGAREALRLAQERNVRRAYLKSKSPSCGVGRVSVAGEVVEGWGVAAWLLRSCGVACHEV
jgi:uncharacterized protein YbbK (DUF523 family)